MENNNNTNWKWYEQPAGQNHGEQTRTSEQPHGQYGGGYSGGYANNGGVKQKHYVTFTQLIITLLVAALLFGIGGVAVGKAISAKNAVSAQNTEENIPLETTAPDDKPSQPLQGQNDTVPPSAALSQGTAQAPLVSATAATSVLQGMMSSVVSIDIEAQVSGNYWYSTPGNETETVGSGSGVILTQDGYIVTNDHVVSGAEKIKVYLQDGTEYEAALIGKDTYTDLAVIKIDAMGLTPAELGQSSGNNIGDLIYAIGNPLGVLATSVSYGIISGLDREVKIDGQPMTLMQVNAAVNHGNSGGGLFNVNGQLIGIVNSKASGEDVEGIGFAIPIDTVRAVAGDLMDYGYVTGRPYLGIAMQNVTFSTGNYGFFGSTYVTYPQIYTIEPGSAAEKAGLLVNDVILAFNGNTVHSSGAITTGLYEFSIGDEVTLTVQRGNEKKDIKVILGERAN